MKKIPEWENSIQFNVFLVLSVVRITSRKKNPFWKEYKIVSESEIVSRDAASNTRKKSQ